MKNVFMRHLIAFMFLLMLLPRQARQYQEWIWHFRINRFDKEGLYHGRWKVYIQDDKVVVWNGRFRHGREVGK